MSLLNFFNNKKPTASVAKERLQIILAHERAGGRKHQPSYLPEMQKELIAVLRKYVKVGPDDVVVALERKGNLDVLDIKIEFSGA